MVLQACYGKELESLDGGLWAKWLALEEEKNRKVIYFFPIIFMLGISNVISNAVQNLLMGANVMSIFEPQIDFVEALEDAQDVHIEKDEHVRLFNDFLDDYVKMENGRYTKRDLQRDMMAMFTTSMDTTYITITAALLEAAKNPKLQQELHTEVVTAFGDDVQSINLKKGLSKIPKLRAFIQLRLHFLFAAFFRTELSGISHGIVR